MFDLYHILIGSLSGFLVGFAKSGVPGAGIMVVPIMALAFGAKPSVGLLLPMLIVGDIFAVGYYRRHAQWDRLWKLLPWVLPGIAIGFYTMKHIEKGKLAPFLGALVLAMLALDLIRKQAKLENLPHSWWFAAFTGCVAGFSTTMGNAAGPIMTIYLLSMNMPKEQFMGTSAWFFMIINWLKVPLFIMLGTITTKSLKFNATALPAIAIGAVAGILLLPRIPQKLFNRLVLVLAAVAAVKLLFS